MFPTSFQLMLVLWFSDHTLRTTAPERVALSLAALVGLVVLFHLCQTISVSSQEPESFLKGAASFKTGRRDGIAGC